jgi:hypothetical protein
MVSVVVSSSSYVVDLGDIVRRKSRDVIVDVIEKNGS